MLSADEHRNLRQVLKNLRLRYGSWSCLGEVMGIRPGSLAAAATRNGHGSAAIALRAARAAGSTVEAVLAGKLIPAGVCPTCGAAKEARHA